MVRKIIAAVLAVGILGMCGGCLRKKPGVRVVEQISVRWAENGVDVCRIHDDPEEMHLILNKLRTLGQRYSPDIDPELLDTPIVTVALIYSDGTQRLYQIKPDRYVRIGEASWQQADPGRITALRLLLLSLPGDLKA